jgi:hypothetical protein
VFSPHGSEEARRQLGPDAQLALTQQAQFQRRESRQLQLQLDWRPPLAAQQQSQQQQQQPQPAKTADRVKQVDHDDAALLAGGGIPAQLHA